MVEYNALKTGSIIKVWICHIGKIEHKWTAVSDSCDYFPVAWGIINMYWYTCILDHIQVLF